MVVVVVVIVVVVMFLTHFCRVLFFYQFLNLQLSTCGVLILLASLSNILKQLAVFIKKVFSVLSAVGWKLETIQPAPLQSCH